MVQEIVDSLATAAARLEESAYPNAIILPNFPRSIQLDGYSCGAKSLHSILRYYNKRCTPLSVEKELHTTYEGTAILDIKRVLKRHGLKYRKIKDLKNAIDRGHPLLISTHKWWHYSVCYGYAASGYFVMNPSLGDMGSISCAVRRKKFKHIWDRWALEVSLRYVPGNTSRLLFSFRDASIRYCDIQPGRRPEIGSENNAITLIDGGKWQTGAYSDAWYGGNNKLRSFAIKIFRQIIIVKIRKTPFIH